MILEGVVTTLSGTGELNIAPMGPVVDPAQTEFLLRPFHTSQTYRNLKENPCGVLHVTDDVLLLARHFLAESCNRWRRPGLAFAVEAEAALVRHGWPGNVRELRNVVEQAVLTCAAAQIDAAALRLSRLPAAGMVGAERPEAASGDLSIEASERGLLNEALSRSKGNVTAAAWRESDHDDLVLALAIALHEARQRWRAKGYLL